MLGWIRSQILEGVYPPGCLLPPERVFATELKINRHTLRSALTRLEAEGLISIKQGEGVRVLDFRNYGEIDLIPSFSEAMQDEILGGVLALRRALAVESVGAACTHAAAGQVARLDDLAKLQECEQDRQAFIERDLEFSRVLVQASGNVPMQMLFNTLLRFYRGRPDVAAFRFRDLEPHRGNYGTIVEMIRRKEGEAARGVVRSVLEQLDERFLADWNALRRQASTGISHEATLVTGLNLPTETATAPASCLHTR